jgi:hypothetical protein
MTIKLCQCLCPQRHCILASLGDGDAAVLQMSLKNQMRDLIRADKIHPFCGLCGAKPRDWFYEVKETPYATMEEALPMMMAESARQVASHEYLKATGEAYDSPLRN